MSRLASAHVAKLTTLVLFGACGDSGTSPTDNGGTTPVATQLAVQTEPSGAEPGELFAVQPVVEVRDAKGILVASDNTTAVAVAINFGGGTLGGTLTATAVSGVAAFTDLQITGGPGGNRTLSFAAPGLTPVTSETFALSCGPSGIVSWWPAETNAFDVVGSNDGTLVNGATFAPGKVGQAFSFDGVDDVVHAEATGISDLQQLTIEAWVTLDSLPSRTERFVTLGNEKAVLRHDGHNSRGQLHFYMRIGGVLRHIRVDDVLQVGVFYHVAGTYNGSVMRLFLDGVEVGNLAISGIVGPAPGVGLNSVAETLDGLLDEVSIYDRALTAAEIQAIFAADSAGKCGM